MNLSFALHTTTLRLVDSTTETRCLILTRHKLCASLIPVDNLILQRTCRTTQRPPVVFCDSRKWEFTAPQKHGVLRSCALQLKLGKSLFSVCILAFKLVKRTTPFTSRFPEDKVQSGTFLLQHKHLSISPFSTPPILRNTTWTRTTQQKMGQSSF